MIQTKEARRVLSSRIDGAVFLMTLFAVTLLGLEAGLIVAVAASVGFFVAGVSKVNLVINRDPTLERIAVSGNLFYASLDRLSNHLRSAPTAHTLLDLSRVSYCDSAALSMIETIQGERRQRGGRLELAAVV